MILSSLIPDDERKCVVFPLMFAANMLVNSMEGNTFTMEEYTEWLNDAGFHDLTIIDVPGPSPLIAASK